MQIFCTKPPCIAGIDLYIAPEWLVRNVLHSRAQKRGHIFQNQAGTPPLHTYLTPGQMARLEDYVAKTKNDEKDVENIICDVDQNVEFGSVGTMIPTLISHGDVVSTQLGRTLLGMEHLAALGEPVFEGCGKYESHLSKALSCRGVELTERQLKALAGKSFHLPLVGCLLVYFVGLAERQ